MADDRPSSPADTQPEAGLDPRDEDPDRTREVQDAHGGSMAPGLVDDTGHPVGGGHQAGDVPGPGQPGGS